MEQMAGMQRSNVPSYSSGMGMGMGMGMMGGYQRPAVYQQQQQQPVQKSARFVELDDKQWEEQFAKLDAESKKQEKTQDKGKGKARDNDENLSEAEQEARIKAALDDLERDVTVDGKEASDRFEELWNSMNAHNATKDGIPPSAADAELAKWEEDLMKRNGMEDFGWNHPGGGLGAGMMGMQETAGLDGTEEALMNGYGSIGADGFPRLGDYKLQQSNPFASHPNPLAEGLRLLSSGGSIADAALLFEAATQREAAGGTGGEQNEVDRSRRERSEAWRRLGEAQAMNERDVQAIRALEEAINIDENNLEAYMVSVCYLKVPSAVSLTSATLFQSLSPSLTPMKATTPLRTRPSNATSTERTRTSKLLLYPTPSMAITTHSKARQAIHGPL
jgi:peroxin-5